MAVGAEEPDLDLEQLLPGIGQHLSDDEQAAVLKCIRTSSRFVHLRDQEILCREDEPGDCLWIIVEGMLSISLGDTYIAERWPGEIVGEQAILEGDGRRSSTVRAVRPSKLCRIDGAALYADYCHSAWLKVLAVNLSGKLRQATERRKILADSLNDFDSFIQRFVCNYSLEKVRASINGLADNYVSERILMWFSDLAGFSSYVENERPEIVAGILRKFMEIQASHLIRVNAEIDKFMGDGLMAFWVAEEPKLAEAAPAIVEAAINIAAEVERFAETSGFDIGLRIGLHHGEVVAGNFGTEDRIAHTIVGPAVNLAARYEQAKADVHGNELKPIRISPPVYQALPAELKAMFDGPKGAEVKHGVVIDIYDGPIGTQDG